MAAPKTLVIFYLTERGRDLAQKLKDYFPEARLEKYQPQKVAHFWSQAQALVFIMACGIVVRTLAPLLQDKKTDPGVVVLDEEGRFALSLLSGHLGGANALAREIAALLEAQAVITTASDLAGLPALDLWARNQGLILEPPELIPPVTARYLKEKRLKVYRDYLVELPSNWKEVEDPEMADLIVSYRHFPVSHALWARPQVLALGLGLHEGVQAEEIEKAVTSFLEREGLALSAFKAVGTLEKRASEEGLRLWTQKRGLVLKGFSPQELEAASQRHGLSPSFAAQTKVGARAVAEPAALRAAGSRSRLLVPKTKVQGFTLAVALSLGNPPGKLWIVGLGPGALEELTPQARKALREASHIVGYHRYLELITPLIVQKEIYSTGMTQEVDRVRKAIEWAEKGRQVALVCGGDPGIYALAGLVFELLAEKGEPNFEIEVVAGLSALNAGAARLGSPLMHDFAVLSLSDRLTPWEKIEARLRAAAQADFVIVIYNPQSRSRKGPLLKAHQILLEYRARETPVGLARAISREAESIKITTLEKMLDHEIDMQTTIFIGNSQTFVFGPWMVTPRGYKGRRF